MANPTSLSVPAIDIPLWLLDRRRLCKDWGKRLVAVKSKCEHLNEAISAKHTLAPIHKFVSDREGRMELKQWVEVERMLIESDEGKEKSLFRSYTSPLIKDVKFIIAMYQKENLFLASIGKEITHRLQFEIPGLKKQILFYDKQSKEESNKAKEADKSATDAMEAYSKECKNLGVPGKALDTEILDLVQEIPDYLKKAAAKLASPSIATFVEFYCEYEKYVNSAAKCSPLLKHLGYVQKYGDSIVELFNIRSAGAEISSDIEKREENKFAVYSSFSSSYNKKISTDFEIIEDTTGADGKKGAGNTDATLNLNEETMLSDRHMRDLVLNDLEESEAFVKRRLQELKANEQSTFTTYEDQEKPPILQKNDNIEFFTQVGQNVQQAIQILTGKRLYMLLNLKHNPDSKERIKVQIERHIGWSEKYQREKKWHQEKEAEIVSEIEKSKKQLDKELKYVEELKADALKGIAEIFKCPIELL